MHPVGVPPDHSVIRAEPYTDEQDDVTQWAPCVLADWIAKEMT